MGGSLHGYGSKLSHWKTAGHIVHVSTCQGKPFWGYPIFDHHSLSLAELECGSDRSGHVAQERVIILDWDDTPLRSEFVRPKWERLSCTPSWAFASFLYISQTRGQIQPGGGSFFRDPPRWRFSSQFSAEKGVASKKHKPQSVVG